MNNLIDQINKDYIDAYKARNEIKVGILRMIKSTLKNAEIEKKAALPDSEVISILKKEIKQRKDTAETYQKAGKDESSQKELSEIKIIEIYLPKQLDDLEIEKIVEKTISSLQASGMNDMGRVIGKIMSQFAESADGQTVSRIVKEKLLK